MVRARSAVVGTGGGKAATLSTLPKGGSRRPSMQRPARRCQRSSPRRADEGRTQSRKRRADERTRTADLLITSEKYGGAGHCSGLLWLAESSYLSGIFFTGLHTIAEHCALGDVEVM